MLSFLPALAPAVLGQELAIPNIATWWLGDPARRNEVLDRLDDVVIGSAFAGDIVRSFARRTRGRQRACPGIARSASWRRSAAAAPISSRRSR